MNQNNSKDDVLFSIVVATYNTALTIRSTIDSVLGQTCQQVEIIVVDGNSRDDTVDILKSYRKNSKLRWVSEPDVGIFDAMNKGALLAKGKYVLFLGADDQLYSEDVLQDLTSRISPGSDVIVGDIIYSNGKVFTSSVSPLLYLINTMHHQAVIYRRQVLLENPFNSARKICGDYELNLFLYKHGYKIQKIGLMVSICGDEGITKQVLLPGSLEEIEIKRQVFSKVLYPINLIFVMTKYLVRKAIQRRT